MRERERESDASVLLLLPLLLPLPPAILLFHLPEQRVERRLALPLIGGPSSAPRVPAVSPTARGRDRRVGERQGLDSRRQRGRVRIARWRIRQDDDPPRWTWKGGFEVEGFRWVSLR